MFLFLKIVHFQLRFNFLLEKTFQDIQTKFIFQIIDFGFNGTVVKRACPSFFSFFNGGGHNYLKGVFAKNERGYRLNAIKKRF